jgi:hypothetical protein
MEKKKCKALIEMKIKKEEFKKTYTLKARL